MWYKLYFLTILDASSSSSFFLDAETSYKEGSTVPKCVKIGGCASNSNGSNGGGSSNTGSGSNGSGSNGNDGARLESHNVLMFVTLLFTFFVAYN